MIYLLWCTVRPEVFMNTHSCWMDRCRNRDMVITKVAVDTGEQKEKLKEYDVYVTGNTRPGVCYPAYCLTSQLQAEDDDIVILASDDFFPPEGWDEYLIDQFKDFDGCLFVRDGYQTPDVNEWDGTPAITLPIMTFSCLKKLNKAIYHPAYAHMGADIELYLNVKELGLLKDNRMQDETTFEHRHYVVGKRNMDKIDIKNNERHKKDKELFECRKNLNVLDRIKIDGDRKRNMGIKYRSQCGQDKYLNENIFLNKRKGFFIEIGAYDGIELSNSYFFEKELEWEGICIEPMPSMYQKLSSNRKCMCVHGAAAAGNGSRDFLCIEGYPSAMSSFVDSLNQRKINRIKWELKEFGGSANVIKVKTYNINDILKESNTNKVDFISIDTEGSELEIVKSIDFKNIDIKCLVIANNYGSRDIEEYLKEKGYELINKCLWDDVYLKTASIKISVLIPYKSDNGGYRDYLWSLVKARYQRLMPELEICLGVDASEPFNRARAINNAANQAAGDVFIITDSDVLFSPEIIDSVLPLIYKHPWIVPFSNGYKLSKDASERIISEGLPPNISIQDSDIEAQFNTPATFMSVITKANFKKIGGMDERFQGWGGEDDALRISLEAICGAHLRLEGNVFHLWHPHAPVYNNYYNNNLKLLKQYINAAGNIDKMTRLINGKIMHWLGWYVTKV